VWEHWQLHPGHCSSVSTTFSLGREQTSYTTCIVVSYNHRSVLNILDSVLANQTPAKGVVTIVCQIEIRKNGGMFISQQATSCLTNHSKLCKSCQLSNQSRRFLFIDFGLLHKVFPQFSQYTVDTCIYYLSLTAIFGIWVSAVFNLISDEPVRSVQHLSPYTGCISEWISDSWWSCMLSWEW